MKKNQVKIINAFLLLNKNYHIKDITIQAILNEANVSRQTFYNYYLDKNDLIESIYRECIVDKFNHDYKNFHFASEYYHCLINMKKYQKLLKEACMDHQQNNLSDYIMKHCQEFDYHYHEYLIKNKLNEEMKQSTYYHALASTSMTIAWIISGMKDDPIELVQTVCQMRYLSMDQRIKEAYQFDKIQLLSNLN